MKTRLLLLGMVDSKCCMYDVLNEDNDNWECGGGVVVMMYSFELSVRSS